MNTSVARFLIVNTSVAINFSQVTKRGTFIGHFKSLKLYYFLTIGYNGLDPTAKWCHFSNVNGVSLVLHISGNPAVRDV